MLHIYELVRSAVLTGLGDRQGRDLEKESTQCFGIIRRAYTCGGGRGLGLRNILDSARILGFNVVNLSL